MAEFRIYMLVDPTSAAVRYVGQTRYPLKTRLTNHLRASRKGERTFKSAWVRSLLKMNLVPVIVLLEETDDPDGREVFWVKQFRAAGCPLTNMTEGGLANRALGGERNPQVRLTWAQVRAIRAEPKSVSRAALGRKYGVSSATIVQILHGRTWKDPEFPEIATDRRTCLKVSTDQVREIRRLYGEEKVPASQLARRFKASKSNISRIVNGRSRPDSAYMPPPPAGPTIGELNGCALLTWEAVRAIRAEPKGQRLADLSARYGISRASISLILLNRQWVDPAYVTAGTRQEQGMPHGGNSKLDWEKVHAIRAEPKGQTLAALGMKYGVSDATISMVLLGRIWKEQSD